MDSTALLIAGAVWLMFNLLSRAARKTEPPRVPPRPRSDPPLGSAAEDATQREGRQLELVLREYQRALEQARATARPTRAPVPRAEEVEEGRSLETEPEVTSLEVEPRQGDRQPVDRDDEAEEIVARRIKAAAARDAVRGPADHAVFEQKIRPEPADHTAVRTYSAQQLRDAVVWREILGPPVSER